MGVWICVLVLRATSMDAQTLVERGKYLVEEVAKCGDCHTPKGLDGKPDFSKLLKGVPSPNSATPDITASGRLWASWKAEGFYNFLRTGMEPSGRQAAHPMPPYKLRADDAGALVEYLKTLK